MLDGDEATVAVTSGREVKGVESAGFCEGIRVGETVGDDCMEGGGDGGYQSSEIKLSRSVPISEN